MNQGIASFMGGSTKEQQLRQQSKEELLNTKTPVQKRRERRAGLKGGEGETGGISKFATQLGAGVLPGAGVADVIGAFPDVEGGYEPGMLVNLQQAKRSFQEGNYKQAATQGIYGALQGLGGAGDVALAASPFAPFALPVAVGAKTVSGVGKKFLKKALPKKEKGIESLSVKDSVVNYVQSPSLMSRDELVKSLDSDPTVVEKSIKALKDLGKVNDDNTVAIYRRVPLRKGEELKEESIISGSHDVRAVRDADKALEGITTFDKFGQPKARGEEVFVKYKVPIDRIKGYLPEAGEYTRGTQARIQRAMQGKIDEKRKQGLGQFTKLKETKRIFEGLVNKEKEIIADVSGIKPEKLDRDTIRGFGFDEIIEGKIKTADEFKKAYPNVTDDEVARVRDAIVSGGDESLSINPKTGKKYTVEEYRDLDKQKTQESIDKIRNDFGLNIKGTETKGIASLPKEQGARKVKERTRIGTTGQYIGAPQGVNSPQKLASLRRKIKGLAIEGAKGRYWYESSGKEILDAVGGDVAEADKIVQAIAITSPQTPVKTNFDYALQAYAQHKAGEPIKTGRFPQAMSKKLQDLFDGKKWEGRKTDDFYNNLMIHIDPERAGPVTGDIWMVRAFGFDKDGGPAPQQYKFITNEIQKISDELGWKPHQTQASVWVNAKARQENPEVKKRTMEKSLKKGFIEYKTNAKGKQEVVYNNKPEHMKLWFKESFDYTPTEAELQKAGFDYADALKNNLGQISWESIPHNTTNHLRGLEQSTPNIKAAYHTDLSKVFLDDKGKDIIAQKLGLVSPGDFEAPGYYQGIVNPGTQTEVVAVKGYKTGKINKIEKSQEDLIEAYAVARGILMKQESVGWHRPFYSATKKDSNGIELNIGRPFSIEEIDNYAKEISKITGNKEYNPISTPEGVRIINFNDEFDNKEFQGLINQATENFAKKLDKSTDVKVEYFSSQNGYLENNWKKDKNGQGYLQRLRKEGQSDLYRKVYDIIEELQPRIDDVDAKFRDEYGFELNEEINSGFRNRNLTDDGSVSVDVKTEKPIKKIEQKAFGGFVESSNYDHYRII